MRRKGGSRHSLNVVYLPRVSQGFQVCQGHLDLWDQRVPEVFLDFLGFEGRRVKLEKLESRVDKV